MKNLNKFLFITLIFSLLSCHNPQNAKTVCEDFYTLRQQKSYDKIIPLFSSDLLKQSPKKETISLLKDIDKEMGKMNSFKAIDFKTYSKNNITFSQFTYKVIFDRGAMTDTITLIKQNDKQKILVYSWHRTK